jgi:hypothetical protein
MERETYYAVELVVNVQSTYVAASFGNDDTEIFPPIVAHNFWLEYDVFGWDR